MSKYQIKHSKVFPEVFFISNTALEIEGRRLSGKLTFFHPCLISYIKHRIPMRRYVFIFSSYKEKIHKKMLNKKKIFVYKNSLTKENKISLIHLNEKKVVKVLDIKDNKYVKTLEPKEALRFKNAYIEYLEILLKTTGNKNDKR